MTAKAVAGVFALLLSLSGCAATFAIGKDATASLRAPQQCDVQNVQSVRNVQPEKRTETVVIDKKALGPDDIKTTTVTEPVQQPAEHESHGSALSKTGGRILGTLTKIACFATLGIVCF